MPPQYKPQPLYDFRNAPDETRGFKVGVTKYGRQGTKRKLEEYAEQVGSSSLLSRQCSVHVLAAWAAGRAAARA